MNYPVATQTILYDVARLIGLDPATNLSPDAAVEILGFMDNRLREGWELYDFLETTEIEERAFRPDYNPALCYEQGDWVWDPCSRKYYQAVNTGVGGPLSNPKLWTQASSVAPAYIQWFQDGRSPIGSAFKAYTLNPYEDVNAVQVPFVISRRGLEFVPAGQSTVWLFFRLPYPGLGIFEWDPTVTYFQGDPVLFNGDTYHSQIDGNIAQSPDTSDTWTIFRVPYVLSRFTYKAAYSDTLIVNGQNEKAPIEEGKAYTLLSQEFDKQMLQQEQETRFNVYTGR
jgi:hypothetical protein